MVEGEVEKKAMENEEEKRKEAEERRKEEDRIRERINFYYDLSKTFFAVLGLAGGTFLALIWAVDESKWISRDAGNSLLIWVIIPTAIVSLVLSSSFFLYSMWTSWSL